MEKSSKFSIYLAIFTIIPLIIGLILTPWFTFRLSIIIYVTSPIYAILLLLALRYIRRGIVYHSFKLGKVTGRTMFLVLAAIMALMLLLSPGFDIDYTGINCAIIILWGTISIVDIIVAIIYKPPKKSK